MMDDFNQLITTDLVQPVKTMGSPNFVEILLSWLLNFRLKIIRIH